MAGGRGGRIGHRVEKHPWVEHCIHTYQEAMCMCTGHRLHGGGICLVQRGNRQVCIAGADWKGEREEDEVCEEMNGGF